MHLRILTRKNKGMTFYNIAAAKFQSLLKDRSTIKARIWYQKDKNEKNEDPVKTINTDILLIDKVTLEDRKGNRYIKMFNFLKLIFIVIINLINILFYFIFRWEYCSRNTVINLEENFILLQRD